MFGQSRHMTKYQKEGKLNFLLDRTELFTKLPVYQLKNERTQREQRTKSLDEKTQVDS